MAIRIDNEMIPDRPWGQVDKAALVRWLRPPPRRCARRSQVAMLSRC